VIAILFGLFKKDVRPHEAAGFLLIPLSAITERGRDAI